MATIFGSRDISGKSEKRTGKEKIVCPNCKSSALVTDMGDEYKCGICSYGWKKIKRKYVKKHVK